MTSHQIIVLGRATKDAEELDSKAKKKYTKFSVAVNEYMGKDKEEKTYFYDVLIFGAGSSIAKDKVKKGDNILIVGKPEFDAYISKKDKEPKTSVTIIADSWKVLK